MAIARVLRLLRTARHLRAEQVAYRLYYRLGRRLVQKRALAPVGEVVRRPWTNAWVAPLIGPRSHFEPGVFEFLGERGALADLQGWNSPGKAKLWLYNLHYLDDLCASDAEARLDQHAWLIEHWIDENPPLFGNGWEPYTLSLRIVNLVKWFARHPEVSSKWLNSLASQAQALVAQEERHILANHLFVNGKALVFAGALLGGEIGERCLRHGLAILDREIKEQFLPDGGHFELSPMYHATLLWDMCDLVNLARCSGVPEFAGRVGEWLKVIQRGLAWLDAMSHPDGEVSFFNDAAFGIAPSPTAIKAYAGTLGGFPEPLLTEVSGVLHLKATGYVVVGLANGGKALLDVAKVGPSYQPGHAHADTLSFELSLYGQRVLVNSGTSQYGEDAERQRQRSTAAHNTLEVNGENSSEVWAGFRVARRARPTNLKIWREFSGDGERLLVCCAHDGYKRLPGKPVHQRQWEFTATGLRIVDSLSGLFRKAVSRFYLHPDIKISGNQVMTLPDGNRIVLSVAGGQVQIIPATWHPEFGVSQKTHCIEIDFDSAVVTADFSWK